MEWINPAATQYSEKFTSAESELQKEISAYTFSNHPDPGMLSGHVQGKLLQTISAMIRPRKVLEIGTLTGYSGICLAEGLTEDGELHTLELRERDAKVAQAFFDKSRFSKQIFIHTGEALRVMETLKGPWDLVFIDADKINTSIIMMLCFLN